MHASQRVQRLSAVSLVVNCAVDWGDFQDGAGDHRVPTGGGGCQATDLEGWGVGSEGSVRGDGQRSSGGGGQGMQCSNRVSRTPVFEALH